jgi:hypothetical protein
VLGQCHHTHTHTAPWCLYRLRVANGEQYMPGVGEHEVAPLDVLHRHTIAQLPVRVLTNAHTGLPPRPLR